MTHSPLPARFPAARPPRPRLLPTLVYALLAGGVLGLIAGVAFLDTWTTRGVSWGPDLTPIAGAVAQPLGVNVFLDKEADPANIDRTLQMARDGGDHWLRQAFTWADIEINAKGDFTDTRGAQPVSAWAKYDYIVDRAQAAGLEILARIDGPPAWAHADQRVSHDPPQHIQDYADFVATLVSRYKGKIRYFQVWNEPNLAGEWAGTPDAAAYTALLKAAYMAAKAANPDAVILMAPLAPTAERGPANISDLIYLQQMYDAGAKPYFDIANVMVYGLGYPPDDRRTDFQRLNFSRPILTRQVMERNGDGGKAMWASEYAWISLPPGWTGKPSTWGASVSEAQQAQYLVDGYRRARAEWPWMGVMFVWNFRDPTPLPNEPATYFQIVNTDFSPRPAYTALQAYARRFPVADTGVHGVADPALTLSGDWQPSGSALVASAVITATTPGSQATITFQGTRLDVLVPAGGCLSPGGLLDGKDVRIGCDNTPLPAAYGPPGISMALRRATVAVGLDDTVAHRLTVPATSDVTGLTLAGFVVSRERPATWTWGLPALYTVLTLLLAWLIGRLLGRLAALGDAALARRRGRT